jgi:NCAIR mutase (PurE)-related protein
MQADLLRELLSEVRRHAYRRQRRSFARFAVRGFGYARLDHHRALRKGFPEVVFCEGKRTEHVVEIMQRLEQKHSRLLATRATRKLTTPSRRRFPQQNISKMHESSNSAGMAVNQPWDRF